MPGDVYRLFQVTENQIDAVWPVSIYPGAPLNTLTPVVSGLPRAGSVLTCTNGTWTNAASFSYQWYSGAIAMAGQTSNSYTVLEGDLGAVITCLVTAVDSLLTATVSISSNSTTVVTQPIIGESVYTTAGTFTFTVPASVTSISYVVIGPGGHGALGTQYALVGGGTGGALAYRNNVGVTPGELVTVVVGITGRAYTATSTLSSVTVAGIATIANPGTNSGQSGPGGLPGGTFDGGGRGGRSGFITNSAQGGGAAGGGAGGYSGPGGDGSGADAASTLTFSSGTAGSGGGGAGGVTYYGAAIAAYYIYGGSGGGVGLFGQGVNGVYASGGGSGGGGGQSGGSSNGAISATLGIGGLYGGGASGAKGPTTMPVGPYAGGGAVRIIWGSNRSFPSSGAAAMTSYLVVTTNYYTVTVQRATAVTSIIPVSGAGGAPTYTYSILPALPAGLGFSATTGAITGTTVAPVSQSVYTVTINDSAGPASSSFTLDIIATKSLTGVISSTYKQLPRNVLSTPFFPFTVSNGRPTYTYSITPALTPGLTFTPATGQISGTPTTVSIQVHSVTATDSDSTTSTGVFTLVIVP